MLKTNSNLDYFRKTFSQLKFKLDEIKSKEQCKFNIKYNNFLTDTQEKKKKNTNEEKYIEERKNKILGIKQKKAKIDLNDTKTNFKNILDIISRSKDKNYLKRFIQELKSVNSPEIKSFFQMINRENVKHLDSNIYHQYNTNTYDNYNDKIHLLNMFRNQSKSKEKEKLLKNTQNLVEYISTNMSSQEDKYLEKNSEFYNTMTNFLALEKEKSIKKYKNADHFIKKKQERQNSAIHLEKINLVDRRKTENLLDTQEYDIKSPNKNVEYLNRMVTRASMAEIQPNYVKHITKKNLINEIQNGNKGKKSIKYIFAENAKLKNFTENINKKQEINQLMKTIDFEKIDLNKNKEKIDGGKEKLKRTVLYLQEKYKTFNYEKNILLGPVSTKNIAGNTMTEKYKRKGKPTFQTNEII